MELSAYQLRASLHKFARAILYVSYRRILATKVCLVSILACVVNMVSFKIMQKTEYLKKTSLWSLVFLFNAFIVHYIFKPLGVTFYSEFSWILGTFYLLYIAIVTFIIWKKAIFVVEWNQVLYLFLMTISFSGISVLLVLLYQYINQSLSPMFINIAETPFLYLSYICPRATNIIFQQIMIFYLLQLTDDYVTALKEQSLWNSIVFGLTHLPIFLIIPNLYVAIGILCGSFIFGYILPILYKKFAPNGLLLGYAIHFSFYLVISPIGYFFFRLVK
jgi:hypothetical protein